jgi:hypothetical protein
VPTLFARARFWPGIVAVILIASMLLPPAPSDARQYLFVQALQFVIFAVAGPALLVLVLPKPARLAWRPGLGRSRLPGGCRLPSTRWPATASWPPPR